MYIKIHNPAQNFSKKREHLNKHTQENIYLK